NRFIAWDCFQRNTTAAEDAFRLLKTAATQGKPYDFVLIDTPIENNGEARLIENILGDPLTAALRIVLLSHHPMADLPASAACIAKSPSADLLQQTMLDMLKRPARSSRFEDYAGRSGNILVVEDNRANQQVARGMLERLGHQVEIAENGNAAM